MQASAPSSLTAASRAPASAPLWRALRAETHAELLKAFRQPGFVLPAVLFPAGFYLLFGILFARRGGFDAGTWFLATYGSFGVIGPALFGFGAALATEREAGWLDLKRVSPMPVSVLLAARTAMSLLFSLLIFLLLSALAWSVAGTRLAPGNWLLLGAVLIVGTVPFCALGLLIGALTRARSAAGWVNLVYLPMGALSGLWFPVFMMPSLLQQLAPVFPAYHLGQLSLASVGLAEVSWSLHMGALLGFTLLFGALAARALKRSEA